MTRRRLGWWRLLGTATLSAGAAILVVGLFTAFGSENPDGLGWDFRVAYLPAAAAVLDGESPYPLPDDPGLDVPTTYAYPPQFAFALTPATALPVDVAVVIAMLACLAALVGALLLLGVRDLRCFAAVPIWGSGWNALEMANVSALLALLLAVAWRFRATLWPLAAALAALISLKVFLWPMLVWAVATRRFRVAGFAVALGILVTGSAWALIGFAGLASYPDLLARLTTQGSYSVAGMAAALGLGHDAGLLSTVVAGGALLGLCFAFARRGDDRRAFVLAIASALAFTPILWVHYLVLLVVPLALMRPRYSVVWLLPIVLWVSPRSGNGDGLDPFLPGLVASVLLLVLLMSRPSTETPLNPAKRSDGALIPS